MHLAGTTGGDWAGVRPADWHDREGIVEAGRAGEGTNSPSGVAGSAASIPLPKTDVGFIGYPQNKAVKLCARTRTLVILHARELGHIARTLSMEK